jgi:DNA-binding Lrp family transcriptional regulator
VRSKTEVLYQVSKLAVNRVLLDVTAPASPSLAVARAALSSADLPQSARLVVVWLALAHNGAAGLYQSEIAAGVGLDERTVRRMVAVLQRRGLLLVDGKGKERKRYVLPGCWG